MKEKERKRKKKTERKRKKEKEKKIGSGQRCALKGPKRGKNIRRPGGVRRRDKAVVEWG